MITDLQEIVLKRFINQAPRVAPSRHHRAFREDIENWLSTLTDKEREELTKNIMRKNKHEIALIGRPMYELFTKKHEVSSGQMGSAINDSSG